MVKSDSRLAEIEMHPMNMCSLVSIGAGTAASVTSVWKLTIASILNSAFVLLVVHSMLDDVSIACETNWYPPLLLMHSGGGLPS